MSTTRLFHESWYQIAKKKICLRPTVRIRRQKFRSRTWYILHDIMSNEYFRINQNSYIFITQLNPNQTIEEIWETLLKKHPDQAPGQEDVIQLISQLHQHNFLLHDFTADTTSLFNRFSKREKKLKKASLMNILYFRVPLWDPDVFLKKYAPLTKRLIFNKWGALIWIAVVGLAAKVVIDNFAAFKDQSQGIIAPNNLLLLYSALAIIKTLHEFGHSFSVRSLGGEVHTMGVMFLVFTPIPYMDATSSWTFRNKWDRALVGASGMLVEIFIAAIMVFVWANTGSGAMHSLAYNIVFIASVSTVIFNINPLLRFDGYYILLDVLEFPNLHAQAHRQLLYLVHKYIFGDEEMTSPAKTRTESFWLSLFAILSKLYLVFVSISIILFISDRFLFGGIILAIVSLGTWLISIKKGIEYVFINPKLQVKRWRAINCLLGFSLALFIFLFLIPFPNSFKAPGVFKSATYTIVTSGVDGYVSEVFTPSGSKIVKNQPLLALKSDELDPQVQELDYELDRAKILQQQARQNEYKADLDPVNSYIESIQKKLDYLEKKKVNLILRSSINGQWIAPELTDLKMSWVRRGTFIGEIVNPKKMQFVSVISQEQSDRLFIHDYRKAQVKTNAQPKWTFNTKNLVIVPMDKKYLPSAALGWNGGGDIATKPNDQKGLESKNPFFEARMTVISSKEHPIYHGQTGKVKFFLKPKPLAFQWWLLLRQFIQNRYQL